MVKEKSLSNLFYNLRYKKIPSTPLILLWAIVIPIALYFVVFVCAASFTFITGIYFHVGTTEFLKNKEHFTDVADYAMEIYDKEKAANDDLCSVRISTGSNHWSICYYYEDTSKNRVVTTEDDEKYGESIEAISAVMNTDEEHGDYNDITVNDELVSFNRTNSDEKIIYSRNSIRLPDEFRAHYGKTYELEGYRILFTLHWFVCGFDYD